MQMNRLMKLSKKLAVVAITMAMPLTAYAAPANFNASYYAAQNPDAVKAFGNDPFKLFEQFIIYGLSEGRVPSENFNAQEFFKENAALAVVVSQAFADVPTASTNSFVQVANQVAATVNAVYADPAGNNVTDNNTTNNTENNTPSNNNSSNANGDSTASNNNQSVNKLQAIKQMTAQATAATIVPPATPDEESLENTSENNSSNQD